jgi:hypothetical protein
VGASPAPPPSSGLAACTRLHGEKRYPESVAQCDAAVRDFASQLPRFASVMSSAKASADDLTFALGITGKMLAITSTIALDDAQLNQRTAGRKSAQEAVGWTFYVAGIVGRLGAKQANATARAAAAHAAATANSLEALYPGVIAEETQAFREHASVPH